MKESKVTFDRTFFCFKHWWKPYQEFDTTDMKSCGLRIANRLSERATLGEATRMSVSFGSPAGVSGCQLGAPRQGTLTLMNRGECFWLSSQMLIDNVIAVTLFINPQLKVWWRWEASTAGWMGERVRETRIKLRGRNTAAVSTRQVHTESRKYHKVCFLHVLATQFSLKINVCN